MSMYKVNIRSKGNGWVDERTATGTVFSDENTFTLNYSLDGDECTLTYNNGKVTQIRRGENCLRLDFEEGKRTSCIIGSGEVCGSYEIYTRRIKFLSGKGGYKLDLEYEGGADCELINLNLTAVKISGEKK